MHTRNLWSIIAMVVVIAMIASCATPPPQSAPAQQATAAQKAPEQAPAPAAATKAPEKAAAPAASQPKSGGTLNLALSSDFDTFDPYFDTSTVEFKAPFFEAPVRISDDGKFEPWLAEKWEVSKDGLEITLNLRKGVKFHNGREMKADDIVWSVQRALDKDKGYHLSDRFTTATGAEKVDDYTVKVKYSKIANSALDGLARLYIFPKEANDTIAKKPVGTGPFQFQEWIPGDHMTAVKFKDYWQQGKPYLDKLNVKVIPDIQSRVVNLTGGSIDLLNGVPLVDKDRMEKTPGMIVGASPPNGTFYAFLMNVKEKPFDNQLVRQALNYAVDRDKIGKLAFSSAAQMAPLPFAPTSWAYPKELESYYKFDLAKAKELLKQAGFPDGFKTQMLVRETSGLYLDAAQVYQSDLAKIGVNMELLPTELPQYWPLLQGSKFGIVSHGTGDATIDPSGLFEGAACCRPFRNFFGITDNTTWFPEYKATIEQASTELDQAKRKELYAKAVKILVEQGWTIPIAWRQQVYAHRDFVKGLRTDLDGQMWLENAWLAK